MLMLSVVKLHVTIILSLVILIDFLDAGCCYTECSYVPCHITMLNDAMLSFIKLIDIMQIFFVLSIVILRCCYATCNKAE